MARNYGIYKEINICCSRGREAANPISNYNDVTSHYSWILD